MSKGYQGTVLTTFGTTSLVEDNATKLVHECIHRQRKLGVVCNDQVTFITIANNQYAIQSILPRKNEFYRDEINGKKKILAANINQLFIVVSIYPEATQYLIERYIIAARINNIKPILVLNKIDLITDQDHHLISKLNYYQTIGFNNIKISTKIHTGIDTLKHSMANNTNILVGQSGVGKSSIVNTLLPKANIVIGDISTATHKGKHTTSTCTRYQIPDQINAYLLDSPGVWEYNLGQLTPHEIMLAFPDFQHLADHCRFNNCTHIHEPDCAIIAAVNNQKLPTNRWHTYKALLKFHC